MYDGLLNPVLAFDLGGSHVAAAVVGDSSWAETIASLPLLADSSADVLLSTIARAGRAAIDKAACPRQLAGISMAAPGPFNYVQGVSNMDHKHPALKGLPLRTYFAAEFSVAHNDICFLNDADAFLLGEVAHLETDHAKIVGLTLGTGIGSAFCADGQLVVEDPTVPAHGEIWNLPWKDGTVEDAIGSQAVCLAFRELTGDNLTLREICAQALRDPVARRFLSQFGDLLGRVVNATCADFQPNCIILGGNIAKSAELFVPEMKAALTLSSSVRVSTLFEKAALYGAAHYWRQARGRGSHA